MVTSVYEWMLAQKTPLRACDKRAEPGNEDILVRILKSLDQAASSASVSSI